ncbi:protein brambleberry-like isoform X4 [Heliangelus exortis]|uniref:protein brambleberry-like isoform X4 n=1 Tax=Heliangelus exortis TaxID=472823 RepID=UPI003A8F8443
MVPWTFWALLLLCFTTRFFSCLCLGTPLEDLGTSQELRNLQKEELWEHLDGWLSPENPANPSLQLLDETLTPGEQLRVAQLMEDIIQWMGNMSRCGAVELQEGHWVVPPNPHQAEEKAWDVHSQRESNTSLLLAQQHWMEEMMEKLQKVNQSLGLLLVAMEGAQNQLENHLQELHSVLEPSGSSPSAISTCILQGFGVLVGLLVPTPPRAVLLLLLLLLLAFSTLGDLLGIQALTTSLLLSMAGGEWVQGGPWGCYKGGLRVLLPSPTLWPSCRTVSGDCHPSWCSESLASVSLSPTHLHPGEGTRNGAVAGGAGQDGNKLPARWRQGCLECHHPCHVLAELSCLEEPPGVARDHPGLAGKVLPTPSGWRTNMTLCGVKPELTLGTRKSWEPKAYNPKQSMTSDVSLMSPRSPCQGLTKAGQRCRKKAIPGQDFCHVHGTSQSSCMDSPPHL